MTFAFNMSLSCKFLCVVFLRQKKNIFSMGGSGGEEHRADVRRGAGGFPDSLFFGIDFWLCFWCGFGMDFGSFWFPKID